MPSIMHGPLGALNEWKILLLFMCLRSKKTIDINGNYKFYKITE